MAIRLLLLSLGLFLFTGFQCFATDNTFVRFNTNLGIIDVQLYTDEAPATTANFLSYLDSGAYNSSIIHRAVQNFVVQGGGYTLINNAFPLNIIPTHTGVIVPGEHSISNTRGTIAMALSTGPSSATDEWFFNVVDNNSTLNNGVDLDDSSDGGPFTVFGVVTNSSGLAVMDQISNLFTGTVGFASPVGTLAQFPIVGTISNNTLLPSNCVMIYSITRLVTQDFTTWQSANFVGQPAGNSDPTATPQKDGVPNLVKYFCDVNPSGPMSSADRAKLPTVGTVTNGGTTYLTLTYHQSASALGVTGTVQTSTDLQTWTPLSQSSVFEIGSDSSTGDAIMQAQVVVTG